MVKQGLLGISAHVDIIAIVLHGTGDRPADHGFSKDGSIATNVHLLTGHNERKNVSFVQKVEKKYDWIHCHQRTCSKS